MHCRHCASPCSSSQRSMRRRLQVSKASLQCCRNGGCCSTGERASVPRLPRVKPRFLRLPLSYPCALRRPGENYHGRQLRFRRASPQGPDGRPAVCFKFNFDDQIEQGDQIGAEFGAGHGDSSSVNIFHIRGDNGQAAFTAFQPIWRGI